MICFFLVTFIFFPVSIFSMNDNNKELIEAIQSHDVKQVEKLIQNKEVLSFDETKLLLSHAIRPCVNDKVFLLGKIYSAYFALDLEPKELMEKAYATQKNIEIIRLIKHKGQANVTKGLVPQVQDNYAPEKIKVYDALPTFFSNFCKVMKEKILTTLEEK